VKALRITRHSESRAQGRLKSDPLGGSLKSAPLAGAQPGAWPHLNLDVGYWSSQNAVAISLSSSRVVWADSHQSGLEREMSEAALGGRRTGRRRPVQVIRALAGERRLITEPVVRAARTGRAATRPIKSLPVCDIESQSGNSSDNGLFAETANVGGTLQMSTDFKCRGILQVKLLASPSTRLLRWRIFRAIDVSAGGFLSRWRRHWTGQCINCKQAARCWQRGLMRGTRLGRRNCPKTLARCGTA
jgi:hypothetical protein